LRAKPSKDGDAELRGYSGTSAMLAGPPALDPCRSWRPAAFQGATEASAMPFTFKLAQRLARMKRAPVIGAAFVLVACRLYDHLGAPTLPGQPVRSEERRVGKECRSGWGGAH